MSDDELWLGCDEDDTPFAVLQRRRARTARGRDLPLVPANTPILPRSGAGGLPADPAGVPRGKLHPQDPGRYANGRLVEVQKWAFTSYDRTWSAVGLPWNNQSLPPTILYICGQPERNSTIDPETGAHRQHFQGFVYCRDKCRASDLHRLIGATSAHATPVGQQETYEVRNYTMKKESAVMDANGNPMWKEAGTISPEMLRPRERHHHLHELLQSGTTSLRDLFLADPMTTIHSAASLTKIAAAFDKPKERPNIRCFFLQGAPGVGKTWAVTNLLHNMDDVYIKENKVRGSTSDFWDGYEGQPVIVFDDFDDVAYGVHPTLRATDRYPLRVNVKYGTAAAKWTHVYFTSNRPFDQLFASLDHHVNSDDPTSCDHWGAFCRRVPPAHRVIVYGMPTKEEAEYIRTWEDYKSFQNMLGEARRAGAAQKVDDTQQKMAEMQAMMLAMQQELQQLRAKK